LYGIRAASVALIAHLCIRDIDKYVKDRVDWAVVLISAIVVYNYPYPSTLITLVSLGAVYK